MITYKIIWLHTSKIKHVKNSHEPISGKYYHRKKKKKKTV